MLARLLLYLYGLMLVLESAARPAHGARDRA